MQKLMKNVAVSVLFVCALINWGPDVEFNIWIYSDLFGLVS